VTVLGAILRLFHMPGAHLALLTASAYIGDARDAIVASNKR